MTKKTKLLLGSLGATAAIVAVPVAVVACSSTSNSTKNIDKVTKEIQYSSNPISNLQWSPIGYTFGNYTFTIKTKDNTNIPIDGIPKSVKTITQLNDYLSITYLNGSGNNINYSLPPQAVVSNITFTNGVAKQGDTIATAATISFYLGVFGGTITGTATETGPTTATTKYTWTSSGAPVGNLDQYIIGLPSEFYGDTITWMPSPANNGSADTINSNINQFIFVYKKNSKSESFENFQSFKTLGCFKGTFIPGSNSSEPGTWTWTYNPDVYQIFVGARGVPSAASALPTSALHLSGVPTSVATIGELVKYLYILPAINSGNLKPSDKIVSVINDSSNKQTITLWQNDSNATIIVGELTDNIWTYKMLFLTKNN